MLMRVFLFLAALTVSIHLSCQEPKIERERIFTGNGLYGFMNGAADLFFEYDFKSLVNRDITYKGETFTLDIYEMPTREDAFGIYSMYVHQCQHADSMGYIDCFSPYQLQAVVDSFYVSIVFHSGSSQAQQIAGELIPLFTSSEHSSMPDIPAEIETLPPFSGVIKYLRGPISVSKASNDLAALLENVDYRGVWFKTYRQAKSYKAAILFSSSQEKEKFEQNIPDSDILRSDNNTLFLQRKEIERLPSQFGEFGF